MAPRIYEYSRVSTPEQASGDGMRRQSDKVTRWLALNQGRIGLERDTTLNLADTGVSGYRGKNLNDTAKLGGFLQLVRSGDVEQGSYLLVENLDRISRQTARTAARALEDLCDAGVTVVTLDDGREYTAELLSHDQMAFLFLVIGFVRGHDESMRKGERVAGAWTARRDAARAGGPKLTRVGPGWLRYDEKRSVFVPIPERVKVVRRIFREAARGTGQQSIANDLNRDGVPVFGRAKYWQRSYVLKILESPAVVGTLIPHLEAPAQSGTRGRTALEPIEGYYPSVVTRELYDRVRALRLDAGAAARGRSASGELRNLFGGLLRCGRCGGAVTRVYKGKPPKGGEYLACVAAKQGAGCKYQAVRYSLVEGGFLERAAALLAATPSASSEVEGQLLASEAECAALEFSIDNVMHALEREPSPALARRLRELEAERERAGRELRDARSRRAATSGRYVQSRVGELLTLLAVEPIDRREVNAVLRQLLSRVTLDYAAGSIELEWKQGGTSSALLWWPNADGARELAERIG